MCLTQEKDINNTKKRLTGVGLFLIWERLDGIERHHIIFRSQLFADLWVVDYIEVMKWTYKANMLLLVILIVIHQQKI